MVHPDYQYTPKLIPAMVSMIANGLHPCVLGSRILGGYALKGGMPWWKYLSNRFLTAVQNALMGAKLSEYHTGYRAYSRELLESMRLDNLSNDFLFDNQFLAQVIWRGHTIGEVSCPTKYFPEASRSTSSAAAPMVSAACAWPLPSASPASPDAPPTLPEMTTTPRKPLFSSDYQLDILICLGLVLAIFIPYHQVAGHRFVEFDDGIYAFQNTYIMRGLCWDSICWAFTNTDSANWHPLTWISHLVDRELFGSHPGGYLLENVAWHALASCLCYLAFFKTTGSRLFAFCGGPDLRRASGECRERGMDVGTQEPPECRVLVLRHHRLSRFHRDAIIPGLRRHRHCLHSEPVEQSR